jgi:hypothetical protein
MDLWSGRVSRAALTLTPSLPINRCRPERDLRTATCVLLVTDPDPQQIHETGPKRKFVLKACSVGLYCHLTRNKQLRFVQHLSRQRTPQEKVRTPFFMSERAHSCPHSCPVYSFPDPPRLSREPRSSSPIQKTPTPSYTIVRREVRTAKTHRRGSEREDTYREPRKKAHKSAVDQAPSGRFKSSEVRGVGDVPPAGLPKRIPVSRRYQNNPHWQEFEEITRDQSQNNVEVFVDE